MAYFLDPLEMESDAEEDESPDDLAISKNTAKALYDGAGEHVEEDSGDITLFKYQHLLNDRVALMIEAVLNEHPLPFKLEDFQLLSLHCIGSLKNVILISPTGKPF